MFCSVCGERLEHPNQRFCQNCGTEIIQSDVIQSVDVSESLPVQEPEKAPEAPIPVPPVPQYSKVSIDEVGSASKKALGFGIVSLIIGLITMIIGGTVMMISSMSMMPYFPYPYLRQNVFIGLTITHVFGIIFGIVSVTSAGRAKVLEPENGYVKAGNALGIIGLIINSILILAAIFLI